MLHTPMGRVRPVRTLRSQPQVFKPEPFDIPDASHKPRIQGHLSPGVGLASDAPRKRSHAVSDPQEGALMAAYRMFPPIGPDRGSRSNGARNNNMKRLVRETRRQASVRGRLTTAEVL